MFSDPLAPWSLSATGRLAGLVALPDTGVTEEVGAGMLPGDPLPFLRCRR